MFGIRREDREPFRKIAKLTGLRVAEFRPRLSEDRE